MSNNAAACPAGGEIGRAQALQARAAGVAPTVDMNPVLLKPQSDRTSQVVVHGRAVSTLDAADYLARRDRLLAPVLESFGRLAGAFDLVVVEGAGSTAETNLRDRDIANMGFARRRGSGVPPRRHRAGRGHRLAGGDPGGPRPRRRGDDQELHDQQIPGRPGALRGRGAGYRAPYRLAVRGSFPGSTRPGGSPRGCGGPRSPRGATGRNGWGTGPDRRAAALEGRELRRRGPAQAGAGGGFRLRPAGSPPAARRRRRRPAGNEVDPR